MTKSVLITGASRGLGEGMARHFAERGYKLALTARDSARLEQLQAELSAQSPQVVIKSLDVSNSGTIAGLVRECARELGGLDIVVVNAGELRQQAARLRSRVPELDRQARQALTAGREDLARRKVQLVQLRDVGVVIAGEHRG